MGTVSALFDPARMPERDEEGMCCHPDLIGDQWNMDDNEEAYDRIKFAEAGYEIDFIWFEHDGTDEQHERFMEDGCDVSFWTPSVPQGDGWLFCGIWDSEDMPLAFYVRPVSGEAQASLIAALVDERTKSKLPHTREEKHRG
jgi:hypothetical protein